VDDIVAVTKGDRTFALFFQHGVEVDGARFLTPHESALQVGVFERGEGYEVKPHRHPERDIHIRKPMEFLYIEKGKAEVTVFDEEWNVLDERTIESGDSLLFMDGGHSLKMLEPTRIIEVKQGPYPGEENAKVFRDPS